MQYIKFIVGLFIFSVSIKGFCLDWQSYATFESLSYNQAISLKSLFNKLDGDLTQGDTFFTHNEAAIGSKIYLDHIHLGIGLVSRYDYSIRYSQDAIQLLYWKGNKLPADRTRDYDLYMVANRVQSNGVTFNVGFKPVDQLAIELRGSGLTTKKLLPGNISGRMIAEDDDLAYQNLRLDYAYDEDIVFKEPVEAPEGHGYTFDIALAWQINPNISADLKINDAYSNLIWENVPNTVAMQNNENVTFDDEGFIEVQPSLGGDNTPRSFSQRFDRRTEAQLNYQLDQIKYWVSDYHIIETHLWQLGVEYSANWGDLLVGIFPEQKGFQLGYRNEAFTISLKTDELLLKKSKLLGLDFGFYHTF